MKAMVNGRILLPDREVAGQALLFGDRIVGMTPEREIPADTETVDAGGRYISPGFVDIHIHGYLGEDASDGKREGLRRMAEGILKNGVTSFLPTTMTVPWGELEAALENIRSLMAESASPDIPMAEILGAHAEGPFINPKRKGAQAEEAICPPEAEKILPWADVIRLITVAPEMPGGLACIRQLKDRMAVSIGHTDADYEMALRALEAGADHFTHLFNAMTGLNHRNPGTVGAALIRGGWCELIADTFHVHPDLYPLLRLCAGERLTLITDCTRAGGMGDGEYELGGQPIFVEGIACRLKDGTIAGSVLRMNEAVRNWREHAHVPLYEAVACASFHPSASVRLQEKKGSLLPGRDADVLLLDENCRVHGVWKSGNCVWKAES
ncbi:MAG: N-acetylglucosamine-6-phosphate deacetylase [Clostridia bacterium]|nr:N-acetylglucosamine-6-phosphate deacetylase [Clostridia bacterium]